MILALVEVVKNTNNATEYSILVKSSNNYLEMKYTLIVCFGFFLFGFTQSSFAQVQIIEDQEVQTTVNKYKSLHQQTTSIKGWRIQIVTTNDRRKMESAIAKLDQKYPNLDYDWKHASPYYQLKVGAFEEKEDLQNMLITLKADFPSSIPVKDEVEKADLVK